jgi:hypothetical protein
MMNDEFLRKGSNRRLESGLYVPNKRRRDVLPLRIYGLTPFLCLSWTAVPAPKINTGISHPHRVQPPLKVSPYF